MVKLLFSARDSRSAERLEAIVSIFINIAIWIIRLVAGITLNSTALITDAWHGLSDAITSVGVLIFAHIAGKPPDKEHPYGHGRAADLGSLLIGIILISLGLYFLYEGFTKLFISYSINREFMLAGIIVTLITVLIKIYNALFASRLGKKYNSTLCLTDALHHKLDAYITGAVVAGLIVYYYTGITKVDALLTIAISAIIMYEGAHVLFSISSTIMDTNISNIMTQVIQIARSVDGVIDAYDVRVRNLGGYYYIDMNLRIDAKKTLAEVHKIADNVEHKVKKTVGNVMEVHIHCEPTE